MELAKCSEKNLFVFATKYCSFINSKVYPIYDSLVIKTLEFFYKQKPFIDEKLNFEKIRQECDCVKYKRIVTGSCERYCLGWEYKDVDKYLWMAGKNM